jgi:hypothetical protein
MVASIYISIYVPPLLNIKCLAFEKSFWILGTGASGAKITVKVVNIKGFFSSTKKSPKKINLLCSICVFNRQFCTK